MLLRAQPFGFFHFTNLFQLVLELYIFSHFYWETLFRKWEDRSLLVFVISSSWKHGNEKHAAYFSKLTVRKTEAKVHSSLFIELFNIPYSFYPSNCATSISLQVLAHTKLQITNRLIYKLPSGRERSKLITESFQSRNNTD